MPQDVLDELDSWGDEMSGIYIKGMEFPQEHLVYDFYPNGEVWEQNWQGDSTLVGKAIPVPDHGRLIDADALRASIKESIDECHKWANEVTEGVMYARVSQSLGTFVECSLRVKAAPTIIPTDHFRDTTKMIPSLISVDCPNCGCKIHVDSTIIPADGKDGAE